MTPKLYNKLRQKINKHCPYLLDLSFGCEVEVRYLDEFTRPYGKKEKTKYLNLSETMLGQIDTEVTITKILGHPPTLSDVLGAINKLNPAIPIQSYGCWPHNKKHDFGKSIEWGEIKGFNWNLSKPYLKDQPDELGEWLDKIIK